MPKIIDVAERREMLAASVLRVVSEGGVEALTVRAVAAQAGISPGLVHHYYPAGKTALLHAAVSLAVTRGMERMIAALDGRRGVAAVRAAALELLPVTAERRSEWTAWAALWGAILTEPALRAEQVDRLVAWREVLDALLTQAVDDGELADDVDTELMAFQLAAFLDGLGMHALVDPQLLPGDALEARLESFLATVTR